MNSNQTKKDLGLPPILRIRMIVNLLEPKRIAIGVIRDIGIVLARFELATFA